MICRPACQVRHLPHAFWYGKGGRLGIALVAESAVPAAAHVVFADIVFAGKRAFKIACAFVEGSSGWTACGTVVQTGFHFVLTFNHGESVTRF